MIPLVRTVLVEPRQPGNVGAAARALANTGLSELFVVDPAAYDPERVRWMAPGCEAVTERIKVVGTLDDALVGVTRVYGTTARHRVGRIPVVDPDELAARIVASDVPCAILYGREDHGLSREAIDRCEAIVRIPTPEHASLNLAQAVLLVSWRLFVVSGARATGRTVGGQSASSTASLDRGDRRDRPAEHGVLLHLAEQVTGLLTRVGYTRSAPVPRVQATLTMLLQRAAPSARQVDAMRGMVNRTLAALDRAEPSGVADADGLDDP